MSTPAGCLMAGKHVVTANKQLVAEQGCELLELARKNGMSTISLRPAWAAASPVLHPLTQCMAANRIDEVYGILNGTTNYHPHPDGPGGRVLCGRR